MGTAPFVMSVMFCSEGCWRIRKGDIFFVGESMRLVPENSELVLACLFGLFTRGCCKALFIESAADDARGLKAWTSDIVGCVHQHSFNVSAAA